MKLINCLKDYLLSIEFTLNLLYKKIKSTLNKLESTSIKAIKVPRKKEFLKWPFYGKSSYMIKRKLSKLFQNITLKPN